MTEQTDDQDQLNKSAATTRWRKAKRVFFTTVLPLLVAGAAISSDVVQIVRGH